MTQVIAILSSNPQMPLGVVADLIEQRLKVIGSLNLNVGIVLTQLFTDRMPWTKQPV